MTVLKATIQLGFQKCF